MLRCGCGNGDFSGRMDHLVRNADGDELLFVHQGAGALYCDYGHLPFTTGDYLVLPRGTMWRIETTAPGDGAAVRMQQRLDPHAGARLGRTPCGL